MTDERLVADDVREAVAAAVDHAVARIEAAHRSDTSLVLERVAALEDRLALDAETRQAHTEGVRKAAAAVHQALAQVEAARSADAMTVERSLAQIEGAWATDAAKIQRTLARIETARAADTTRLHKQIAAVAEPAGVDAADGQARVDEIRTAVLATTEEAITQIEAARAADTGRLLGQMATLADALTAEAETRRAEAEELRVAVAGTIERALAAAEGNRAAETARLVDQVAAVERSPTVEAAALQAQIDEARHTVAAMLDQVVNRIEALHGPDAAALVEGLTALAGRAASDLQRHDERATVLLAAMDERLRSLHLAGAEEGDARADRLADRVESSTAKHVEAILTRLEAASAASGRAVIARLDERTAPIPALAPEVAARVNDTIAAALTSHADRLVTRLVEATDALAQGGGRIEAVARDRAEEARAAEEQVAALLVDVAERAERAVDRSRARIAEGQVALSSRLESVTAELLKALGAATEDLEAKLAESVKWLRTTGGHQNDALLAAVTGGDRQLEEGLAEVRAALAVHGPEVTGPLAAAQRAELTEAVAGLRATVESLRQDTRLDALIDEHAAVRQAQLAAVDRVCSRIDEVGPVVARALLSEVDQVVRAASAGEADALADLVASSAAVHEAVQLGVHKAELAALDIRGLRDRLTPHLLALAEATTRRAEADQAGFDAVLARLDTLLTARRD